MLTTSPQPVLPLRFTLPGHIPVVVDIFFWVTSILIAYNTSSSFFGTTGTPVLIGTAIVVPLVFLSIIWHEMGHAYTCLWFGGEPSIQLQCMGGVASFSPQFTGSRCKFATIVFAGPFAGLLLAAPLLGAYAAMDWPYVDSYGVFALNVAMYLNIIWSLLNLLPIYPLDGGQLLLIAVGEARWSWVLGISVGTAIGVALFFGLYWHMWITGAMIILLPALSFYQLHAARTNAAASGARERPSSVDSSAHLAPGGNRGYQVFAPPGRRLNTDSV